MKIKEYLSRKVQVLRKIKASFRIIKISCFMILFTLLIFALHSN